MNQLTLKKNKFTHLFIVGAQRSGTTALKDYLKKYKEILFASPETPEPKYFLQKKIDYQNYVKTYFNLDLKKVKILAEKTTSYFENKLVPQKLKKLKKKLKIIIILRNPIHRAYSNYKFSKENNYEKFVFSFKLSKQENRPYDKKKISVSPYKYFKRGEYIKNLDHWFKFFSKEDVLILNFEKLILNDQKTIKSLCKFLKLKFNKKNIFTKKNSTENKKISKKDYILLSKKYYDCNNLLKKKYKIDIKFWKY